MWGSLLLVHRRPLLHEEKDGARFRGYGLLSIEKVALGEVLTSWRETRAPQVLDRRLEKGDDNVKQ